MKAILTLTLGMAMLACQQVPQATQNGPSEKKTINQTTMPLKDIRSFTEEDWKRELTEEEYAILRQKGTERAFTGKYWDTKDQGKYYCKGCGAALFDSESKFDSHCGWPSYFTPISDSSITEQRDLSHGMIRTEVTCSRCGGHLGHVFTDGPAPTGLRYCINSASIHFVPNDKKTTSKE